MHVAPKAAMNRRSPKNRKMVETTTASKLQCVIVTPERAVLDEPVDFVALPLYDGELGVLPGRAPLIGRLGAGELRIIRNHQTERFFVDGGFVQVRDDVVSVLTPRALPAAEIRIDKAEDALKAAMAPADTPEGQDAQLKAQQRARAQIRIAKHEQGEE
jgi:F-type H+-transporting ATPase subunit epsilon